MKIRDPYGSVFEVDDTALPFWEHREGYEVLDTPGDEPTPVEPAALQPDISGDPTTSKAAVRRARSEGEGS